MKYLITLLLLFFAPLRAFEGGNLPDDQLLVIFGSSGYILYKVLDFANDHGFRYIKIVNYTFRGFDHTITGACPASSVARGRFFELKDENTSVSFECFEEKPTDAYVIDLEKYRSLIEPVD